MIGRLQPACPSRETATALRQPPRESFGARGRVTAGVLNITLFWSKTGKVASTVRTATFSGSEVMRVALTTWMFPYVEACRKAGVLELDAGDVLDLKWDGGRERPSLCPPGSGSRRAIVIRVDHAWHGYAEKIIVSPMM